jgi:hypothetical protein
MSKVGWPDSGPKVARLFDRLLALVFLDAFVSLGAQVHVLYGSRGLIPATQYLAEAHAQGLGFLQFPTLFWWGVGDGALTLGIVCGVLVSLIAVAGVQPRVCLALATVLYLSFVGIGHTFLYFQWDNLILECGFFSMFLPRNRRAPLIHLVFRLILFKLYWESGIAKYQSHLKDWHDGSAMTYYYETAPLPTWPAWFAHHLPAGWHHLESWLTLGFELVLPFGIFAPRKIRIPTAAFLTSFQVVNALTANYGFFCYLATVLHLFMFDDRDVERVEAWLRRKLKRPPAEPLEPKPLTGWRRGLELGTASLVLAGFTAISIVDGLFSFTEPGPGLTRLAPVREFFDPFRIVNTYHLFGHITRERIEPEFQTFDGTTWTARDLRYKAGDPTRRPSFVAPHQPRVAFQMWFYGLSYERRAPIYVVNLLDRMCNDPDAVDGLFREPLPRKPQAVRIVFWQYHFTDWATLRSTGAWWRRDPLGETRPVACEGGRS